MLPSDFPVRRSVCDTSPTPSASERCFVAHGQSYGLRAHDGDLLDRLATRVPLGWHASAVALPEISTWYLLCRADDPEAAYRLTIAPLAVSSSSMRATILAVSPGVVP